MLLTQYSWEEQQNHVSKIELLLHKYKTAECIESFWLSVLAVTVSTALVWVDRDGQATNCCSGWGDGGTSDGVCLRLKCLLCGSFKKKK